MEKFKVELVDENAVMPFKAYPDDAGYDLVSPTDVTIWPGEVVVVDLGFIIELKNGYEAQIRSRSSISSKNKVIVVNGIGTIDAKYRGHVMVALMNLCKDKKVFTKGTKIAQMVICKLPDVEIYEGKITEETDRGDGGFGSTGENHG